MRRAASVQRIKAKQSRRRSHSQRLRANESVLLAPGAFSLDKAKSRRALAVFLQSLRIALARQTGPVRIDMSCTQRFRAPALLLFVAELDRLVRATKAHSRVRIDPPRNQKALAVLDQLGVLRRYRCVRRRKFYAEDVVFWRYATGSDVDGRKFEDILGEHEAKLTTKSMEGLFKGLSEAMTNCHHHAYTGTRNDGLALSVAERRWWMFSQARDGALEVVFCDLGVGIPETLPANRPAWRTRLESFFGQCADQEAIWEATNVATTSTDERHRGKGLPEIVSLVRIIPGAVVSIRSNRGSIVLSTGRGSGMTTRESIFGTLISWRIPMTTPPEEGNTWANR